jgi:glycosyltransferase involved in cell wall biosynthesis
MNVGGPAIQITGLMSNMDRDRYEQLLVTGYCGSEEIDYLDEHGIVVPIKKIAGFGQRISFVRDLRAFREIRNIIKSFNPDIIHTHTAKAGVLGRVASLTLIRRKSKRIHTFHGHLLHGYFGNTKTALVIMLEKFLARSTHTLITVGNQVKFDLLNVKIGTPKKYRVVGPGLQLGEIPRKEIASSTLGLLSNEFTVTWIGRAVEVKAPHRILEIAKQCKEQKIDVRFLFVGDGPLKNQLEKASHNEQLKVTFLGWQNNIEVVLGASDLVVLTSLNEGTPVALIQAQMAGIPVLTTLVGSAAEVLISGSSGYAFPYSKEQFTSYIREFSLNQQKCEDFGRVGRVHALSKFSLQNLVKEHEEIYEHIISQSNF